MPPSPEARARPSTSSTRRAGSAIGRRLGQDLEGQRLQGFAGQDRGRLVEGLVHGRAAASQIVVVHGGQIVVDEGIAMQELDGGAGAHGPRPF